MRRAVGYVPDSAPYAQPQAAMTTAPDRRTAGKGSMRSAPSEWRSARRPRPPMWTQAHRDTRYHGGDQLQSNRGGDDDGEHGDHEIRCGSRPSASSAHPLGTGAIGAQRMRGGWGGPRVETVGVEQRIRRPYKDTAAVSSHSPMTIVAYLPLALAQMDEPHPSCS